jgi:hypothetical protein
MDQTLTGLTPNHQVKEMLLLRSLLFAALLLISRSDASGEGPPFAGEVYPLIQLVI